MKPLRIPGDPATAAVNYLKSTIPALLSGTDPTVSLGLREDWTPKS